MINGERKRGVSMTGNWWNDTSFDIITRDMVVMMIALYVTCSSNGDSAEDSANPNVGKDLTDEEKNELGGTGSGAPGGPEDEDEWNKMQSTGSSEGEIKNTYGSIKDAPQYPKGFRASQNGTVKNVVKNQEVLENLRKVEPGKWSKVYKDGYDVSGRRVSIHYFESQSGRVFNVKVKPEWSNFK